MTEEEREVNQAAARSQKEGLGLLAGAILFTWLLINVHAAEPFPCGPDSTRPYEHLCGHYTSGFYDLLFLDSFPFWFALLCMYLGAAWKVGMPIYKRMKQAEAIEAAKARYKEELRRRGRL